MKGSATKAARGLSSTDCTAPEGASPHYAVRFDSSMAMLASSARAADDAHFLVLENAAGVVLEQVLLAHDFSVPAGDEPFRCETIAAAVSRCNAECDADLGPSGATPARAPQSGSGSSAGDRTCEGSPLLPEDEQSVAVEKYDADFATQQRNVSEDSAAKSSEIPEFPGFDLHTNFSDWTYDNVLPEDLVEASTIFGSAGSRTSRTLSHAMTIVHGLPGFADRIRGGEFTRAHVDVVGYLCESVAFRFLPELDEYLVARAADTTCESLRTSLRKKINLLQPPVDRSDMAAKRRRVDVEGRRDGSACLTLSGPSTEIFASFHRMEAMARAIHGKNASTFNLPPGTEIADERGIAQLMYDLMIRPVPEISIKVRDIDSVTGVQNIREGSIFDADGELVVDTDSNVGLADFAKKLIPEKGSAAFGASTDKSNSSPEFWVSVRMPTSQWWLAHQAATVATVPYLTLIGESDLPGTFSDGSPIPASMARVIAGRSKTLQRILTDPATGTPIDSKATSYSIPKDLRRTLVEQWTICTVPGCPRKAAKSEIDHVKPFFHLNPLKGGLTRFGNLHCLCKKHHALKTARKYAVRMLQSGLLEYEFAHGVITTVAPPDQPIDIEHALEFAALTHIRPPRWRLPEDKVPPPPSVLELMPGESTIRQRNEAERKAKVLRAEQEQRRVAFENARAARRRLMVERSLDWQNAIFQPCLPPGTDPTAVKQLTGNAWRARRGKGLSPEMRAAKIDTIGAVGWTNSRTVNWDHGADDPPPF